MQSLQLVLLTSLAGTPSGPVALCGLRFFRSFITPEQFTSMLFIVGWETGLICGRSDEVSLVKTEQNWWFSMLALVLGSLCNNPPSLRVATPVWSQRFAFTKAPSLLLFEGSLHKILLSSPYWLAGRWSEQTFSDV